MVARRDLLKGAVLGAAWGAFPSIALARLETDARFVLFVLRGALDGLAAVPPFGDGNYGKTRGELALPAADSDDGLWKLDGLFGLHRSLATTYEAYRDGEATVVHAIASPYRERSHFDGQDVLEQGGATVGMRRDGWLNRALAPLSGGRGTAAAIALEPTAPLVLRGGSPVTSWAPSRLPDADDDTIARLQDLYADDEFFAKRLAQALRSQEIAEAQDEPAAGRRGNRAARLKSTMDSAARFLATDDGPRIAVVETGGWDTHANQGAARGALAYRLAGLDAGLAMLKTGLGDVWSRTVVAVVTEFGRTVRVNGTRGTDHGTATAALLLGGAVNGGRVIADWPGLAGRDLYENRDLRPTADLRSLFKGVLADHLSLPAAFLEREVFPDSAGARPMPDLVVG